MFIKLKNLGYISADTGYIHCNCCDEKLVKLTDMILFKRKELR